MRRLGTESRERLAATLATQVAAKLKSVCNSVEIRTRHVTYGLDQKDDVTRFKRDVSRPYCVGW